MLGITQRIGGNVINSDRMWHYTEGVTNWDPIWKGHGIARAAGPVVALARCDGKAAAGAAIPRVRYAWDSGISPTYRS